MRPIDTPTVEREIPGDTAPLEGIAGIIDRTLDGKTTKRPHVKSDRGSSRRTMRNGRYELFIASRHGTPDRNPARCRRLG